MDDSNLPAETYSTITPVDVGDELPEGATLVLDSKDAETVTLNLPQKEPKARLTRDQFMAILSQMISSGDITPRQAQEMRRRFGITNASFHNRKVNKAKKKKAKTLAYKNQRTNRLNGSKKGESKQINRSKI